MYYDILIYVNILVGLTNLGYPIFNSKIKKDMLLIIFMVFQ